MPAGVLVDDVDVHQPSLDDVFFALTGTRPPMPTPSDAAASGAELDLQGAPHDPPRSSRPGAAAGRRPPAACVGNDVVVLTRRNLIHIAASRCSSPT